MHFLDVKTLETGTSRDGNGQAGASPESLLDLLPRLGGCLQLRPKSTHRHLRRSCETTSATATPSAASKQTEQDDLELEMKPQLWSCRIQRWPSLEVTSSALTALASPELQRNLCSFLLQTLTPFATPGMHAGGSGATMAFCPFPLCGGFGSGLECAPPLPELSLQALQRGLLVATFLQGSLGLLRICLGDFFSGSYTLLLATLGYNSRHPGPSSAWLKTYVLISFINGTMGHIDLMQNTLLHNFPSLQLTLPVSVNLMHMVQLMVPGCSYCGAYFGWQHLKAQRKMMLEAYQREWMMMMERPPWPPPPLIPLPGMPGGPPAPGMNQGPKTENA